MAKLFLLSEVPTTNGDCSRYFQQWMSKMKLLSPANSSLWISAMLCWSGYLYTMKASSKPTLLSTGQTDNSYWVSTSVLVDFRCQRRCKSILNCSPSESQFLHSFVAFRISRVLSTLLAGEWMVIRWWRWMRIDTQALCVYCRASTGADVICRAVFFLDIFHGNWAHLLDYQLVRWHIWKWKFLSN